MEDRITKTEVEPCYTKKYEGERSREKKHKTEERKLDAQSPQ